MCSPFGYDKQIQPRQCGPLCYKQAVLPGLKRAAPQMNGAVIKFYKLSENVCS